MMYREYLDAGRPSGRTLNGRRAIAPPVALQVVGLAMASLVTQGCWTDTHLGSSQLTWVWPFAALLGFSTLGYLLARDSRTAALEDWRLDASPVDPGNGNGAKRVAMIAAVTVFGFGLLNAFADFSTRQKLINVGLALTAAIFASVLGITLGLSQADRHYLGRHGSPK